MLRLKRLRALVVAALVICQGQVLAAQQTAESQESGSPMLPIGQDCGTLDNAFGPFDYTNARHVREHLSIVETFHFNSDVESLRRGQTSEIPGGDLDYTLRAFPNHHRALYSMAKYQLRHPNKLVPPGAKFSAECYFVRAIRFQPDDANVHLIFGIYLAQAGRAEEALQHYTTATRLAPDSAEVHYNLALLYRKLGRPEYALKHARIAYDLGYPLQGLKRQLQRDGIWQSDGTSNQH